MGLTNEILRCSFEQSMQKIYDEWEKCPWHEEGFYAQWLAQTYHMVKNTTRLIARTAGQFTHEEQVFHEHSLQHFREEIGHEKLLLKDLIDLNVDINQIPISIECDVIIQTQYYFCERHPLSHFGLVICLEKLAAQKIPDLLNRLSSLKGTSFLKLHGDVDPYHVSEIIEILNASPESEIMSIAKNTYQTGILYSSMLRSLEKSFFSQPLKPNLNSLSL